MPVYDEGYGLDPYGLGLYGDPPLLPFVRGYGNVNANVVAGGLVIQNAGAGGTVTGVVGTGNTEFS